jgi:hypothetical protein
VTDVIMNRGNVESQDDEIYLTLLLIGIVCFKPLKTCASPSKLPYQKVMRVLLPFLKRKEIMLAHLLNDSRRDLTNSYSNIVRSCRKTLQLYEFNRRMQLIY